VVFLILLVACSPSPKVIWPTISQTQIASQSVQSEANNEDLCEWFNKSLLIRNERIPAILKVQAVRDKYNNVKFSFDNHDMVEEYINATEDYLEANNNFIRAWNELREHPLAKEYWENELKAVQTWSDGYALSLRGFIEHNARFVQQGAKIFESGKEYSDVAEAKMVELREGCK